MPKELPIRLAEETISPSELESLASWLTTNPRLTKGPLTEDFEAAFAEMVGAKFAVFVNSGSSANLLAASVALQSGRLTSREASCPAISWVTTVTPFEQLGYRVSLVGADSKSLGLKVEELEELFEKRAPGVLILVHVLGHANDIERIVDLCDRYGVFLIEDSCEALGSSLAGGKWLGTFGDIGTYSFYYGHHISTIEGGMAVTNDEALYELMLSIRSHGWSRDLSEDSRETLQSEWSIDNFSNLYTFYNQGFNLRPTDLQAKIGLSQLPLVDEIRRVRERNFERYQANLPGYWSQSSNTDVLSSFAYGTLVENREDLAHSLRDNGIEARPLVCGNIGRHPFWLKQHEPFEDEVADAVHKYGIYLPNHLQLSEHDIDRICAVVLKHSSPLHVR